MNIEYYQILLPIALILIVSKILMKICQRFNLPEVIGMLLAGIIVGLIQYIPRQDVLGESTRVGLDFLSKTN